MDEETFKLAREYDLDYDDAIKLQEIMEENDLDPEDALELIDEL